MSPRRSPRPSAPLPTGTAATPADLDTRLADADSALAQQFPGERATRQPVHTVYVPADRYDADLVPRWGQEALKALHEHGGNATDFAATLGLPGELADDVV